MEYLNFGIHKPCPVSDQSHVASLRRDIKDLIEPSRFDEALEGRVLVVATELATNLLKHTAQGGEVLIRRLEEDGRNGVELIALDKGRGIANVSRAMEDNVSTTGSSGTGLGAIKRFSHEFDFHSEPGKGTAVFSRLWQKKSDNVRQKTRKRDGIEVGTVMLAMPGEDVCGDGCSAAKLQGCTVLLVVDGLGHGMEAALSTQAAQALLEKCHQLLPAEIIARMHEALRGTRGAAVSVASFDHTKRRITCSGVGNIAARIVSMEKKYGFVSLNGVVGFQRIKIQEFTEPWPEDGLLIMHSDGLKSRWDLSEYANLSACHPALIAAVLYRDFTRGRDDVTVMVAKWGGT